MCCMCKPYQEEQLSQLHMGCAMGRWRQMRGAPRSLSMPSGSAAGAHGARCRRRRTRAAGARWLWSRTPLSSQESSAAVWRCAPLTCHCSALVAAASPLLAFQVNALAAACVPAWKFMIVAQCTPGMKTAPLPAHAPDLHDFMRYVGRALRDPKHKGRRFR